MATEERMSSTEIMFRKWNQAPPGNPGRGIPPSRVPTGVSVGGIPGSGCIHGHTRDCLRNRDRGLAIRVRSGLREGRLARDLGTPGPRGRRPLELSGQTLDYFPSHRDLLPDITREIWVLFRVIRLHRRQCCGLAYPGTEETGGGHSHQDSPADSRVHRDPPLLGSHSRIRGFPH